jgi:hypothetical protein
VTRTEPCVCGGEAIRSPSLKESGIHVCFHNQSPVHVAWRRMNAAIAAYELERDSEPSFLYDYRDSRRPTADVSPVDSVQGEPGASASGNAA